MNHSPARRPSAFAAAVLMMAALTSCSSPSAPDTAPPPPAAVTQKPRPTVLEVQYSDKCSNALNVARVVDTGDNTKFVNAARACPSVEDWVASLRHLSANGSLGIGNLTTEEALIMLQGTCVRADELGASTAPYYPAICNSARDGGLIPQAN